MANQDVWYIGDGVYASTDGYHIWLSAGGTENNENQIALEPAVFDTLLRYRDAVMAGAWSEYNQPTERD